MDICITCILRTESFNQVYQLSYQPCPIWSINDEVLINLNPESPYYRMGSFKRLLDYHRSINGRQIIEGSEVIILSDKECIVFAREEIDKIIKDAENEGFKVKLLDN